jgi:ABC-2 type transport system ATP-binding protein
MLTAALSRVNSAHIELADIVLRRPSLDDVFLSLTGHAAAGRSTERVADEVLT